MKEEDQQHIKDKMNYCIYQKDKTLPKVSKVVENHAFSECNFTEHALSRGYGCSRYIVNKHINTIVIPPAFVRSVCFHSEKA